MNKLPNRKEKINYLIDKFGYGCPMAKEKGLVASVSDPHHRCHDTKWRVKKFPLFIHSILNIVMVNHGHHMSRPSWGKITDYQAERYERFLELHPKASIFVNNPEGELFYLNT